MANLFVSVLLKNSISGLVRRQSLNRTFHLSSLNMIKVGDQIPSAELYEGDPGNVVNIAEICKDKKVVIFGLPGAFTPGCSKTHLPGFIQRNTEFREKGVEEILCVSVNDAFVMDAWGKDHDATGKVRLLADPCAVFTKMVGLDIDIPKLGGTRSKRYSMLVDKGLVKFINVEPDGTGLTCSLAAKMPL